MIRRVARKAGNWWGRRFRSQAVILLYHRVADLDLDPWSLAVTPEHFAEHLEVLRRSTNILSLSALVRHLRAGQVPRNSVVLTFDDGYRDNLVAAKPLLERYEVPATVFVATKGIESGGEFWWDELEALLLNPNTLPTRIHLDVQGEDRRWDYVASKRPKERPEGRMSPARLHLYRSIWKTIAPLREEDRLHALSQLRDLLDEAPSRRDTHRSLTAEEVADLADGTLVEIGAHTVTHPVLAALPAGQQRHEIEQSKRTLEEVTQRPVTAFSYPFGKRADYTPETVALVQALGLECACSNLPGAVDATTDPLQLPRLYVHDEDGDRFAKRLSEWVTLTPHRTTVA